MNAYRSAGDDRDNDDGDDGDWDDAWDVDEDASGDAEDSGDEPTVPCPSCRREMLEDSPHCPHCGRYLSEEDHSRAGKPIWVVATAMLCLAVAIWWVFTSH